MLGKSPSPIVAPVPDSGNGRARHRLKMMEMLIGYGPMTRSELGTRTGLSGTTLAELTSALIAEGLVLAGRVGGSGPGRPKQMLEVNAGAGHVIGIKISMHEATLSLTNFAGEALGTRKVAHLAGEQDVGSSARILGRAVDGLLSAAQITAESVAGIGVGLPGFILTPSGHCLWSPVFSRGVEAFAGLVEQETGIAVRLENDVNLVTLAERWFGHGRGVDHFMVITLEHGLGMGLFLNGELYAGPNGLAAEFGHVIVERGGRACRCGRAGCLEAYVSDGALATRAAGVMGRAVPRDGFHINQLMAEMTKAALQGDAHLRIILAEAGDLLGRETARIANILAPQRVIVTGEAMRAEDLLMRPFSDGFHDALLPMLREQSQLVWHKASDEVWAKGAAARVLSERFAGAGNPLFWVSGV